MTFQVRPFSNSIEACLVALAMAILGRMLSAKQNNHAVPIVSISSRGGRWVLLTHSNTDDIRFSGQLASYHPRGGYHDSNYVCCVRPSDCRTSVALELAIPRSFDNRPLGTMSYNAILCRSYGVRLRNCSR